MKKNKNLFTSESVSEGHPDKLADQISDSILDEALRQDKNSRVACEVMLTTEKVIIAGEVKTKANIDYEKIARQVLKKVGYTHKDIGIGCDSCDVEVLIHEQSNDIAIGVNENKENNKDLGAGDQGIMFGFATNETKEELMPLAIVLANELVKKASTLRHLGALHGARPDMKSQVTLDYTDPNNVKVDTVLMSVQHFPDININDFKLNLINNVIDPILRDYGFKGWKDVPNILINPTGRFVIGGPHGDAGLTGRKIIVDTYGGAARHGGGAFSGKDGTKVDRSGAYVARWIAKNLVASELCEKCEIQLSYAIGISQPTSININTFGTGTVKDEVIEQLVEKSFDLRPAAIIEVLRLNEPIFSQTAKYGHFGRIDLELPWEELNKVNELKKHLRNMY